MPTPGVDIDECQSNLVTCSETSTCENTVGSFVCKCISGYGGEGCTDIDECSNKQFKLGVVIAFTVELNLVRNKITLS